MAVKKPGGKGDRARIQERLVSGQGRKRQANTDKEAKVKRLRLDNP
jgi:hypothetical protein